MDIQKKVIWKVYQADIDIVLSEGLTVDLTVAKGLSVYVSADHICVPYQRGSYHSYSVKNHSAIKVLEYCTYTGELELSMTDIYKTRWKPLKGKEDKRIAGC